MRPDAAFTLLIVIVLLLVLTPVTLVLHQGEIDTVLAVAFVSVALFLFILASWMRRRSDVVRVIYPYRRLGLATFLFVLGALLIFAAITALLMDYRFTDPLPVGPASNPLHLPGLNKLLPVVGVLLMLLGLWVKQSDKIFVKLER